jgi:hypothetical protein
LPAELQKVDSGASFAIHKSILFLRGTINLQISFMNEQKNDYF